MVRRIDCSSSWRPGSGVSIADELGTIEVGKRADLTLFDGDVLDLIPKGGEIMREAVSQVWMDGHVVHNRF